jgi:hypothetical protein
MWGISLPAENRLASQERLCSMEWVSNNIKISLVLLQSKKARLLTFICICETIWTKKKIATAVRGKWYWSGWHLILLAPRSPDLAPCKFPLLCYVKFVVFSSSLLTNIYELQRKITEAFASFTRDTIKEYNEQQRIVNPTRFELKKSPMFRVCKSVHLHTFKLINQLDAGRPDHDQQHCYHHVPTVNQRLLLQLISSWWWARGCPKHVELYLNDKQ